MQSACRPKGHLLASFLPEGHLLANCLTMHTLYLLVYSRRYPKYSRLTLPWILVRLRALFTLFSVLGVGPDPRATSPSARRRSICYPQHSAGGRGRCHRVVRPLEKLIKIVPLARLMVSVYYFFFYNRNNNMRHFNNLPRDNGSRRSQRCPPSHPLMVLPSHPVQASARTARPSGPLTHAASMGRASPLLHQPKSTTYSPPTSATMGGEYCPMAVPSMLSAPAISSCRSTAPFSDAITELAILSYRLTAPFSDAITENSWPQTSWVEIPQKLAQINAMLAWMSMKPLYHSPPLHIAGGARCRQHVIYRRPKQVHQTAWPRGRWHPCLLPQRGQHHR
jgi:hypothetical protein